MQAERSISRRSMLLGATGSEDRSCPQVADHCLSSSGVTCRTCEDACGLRAIRFHPRRGEADLISIDAETCTGCGDCLPVCPVAALSFQEMQHLD